VVIFRTPNPQPMCRYISYGNGRRYGHLALSDAGAYLKEGTRVLRYGRLIVYGARRGNVTDRSYCTG